MMRFLLVQEEISLRYEGGVIRERCRRGGEPQNQSYGEDRGYTHKNY